MREGGAVSPKTSPILSGEAFLSDNWLAVGNLLCLCDVRKNSENGAEATSTRQLCRPNWPNRGMYFLGIQGANVNDGGIEPYFTVGVRANL
jgi:hypothetical protein